MVPEEIKDAVASMDWPKLEEEAAQEKERKAQDKEVTRLAAEIESDKLKRKAQEPEASSAADGFDKPKHKKHKPAPVSQEPQAIQEISIQPVSVPQPDQRHRSGQVKTKRRSKGGWERAGIRHSIFRIRSIYPRKKLKHCSRRADLSFCLFDDLLICACL